MCWATASQAEENTYSLRTYSSSSLLKDISHDGWQTLVKYGWYIGTIVYSNGAADWAVQKL